MEERFVIGPVADRDFWARERASMAIDRGPCRSNLSVDEVPMSMLTVRWY